MTAPITMDMDQLPIVEIEIVNTDKSTEYTQAKTKDCLEQVDSTLQPCLHHMIKEKVQVNEMLDMLLTEFLHNERYDKILMRLIHLTPKWDIIFNFLQTNFALIQTLEKNIKNIVEKCGITVSSNFEKQLAGGFPCTCTIQAFEKELSGKCIKTARQARLNLKRITSFRQTTVEMISQQTTVERISHQKPGHTKGNPEGCVRCGRDIAQTVQKYVSTATPLPCTPVKTTPEDVISNSDERPKRLRHLSRHQTPRTKSAISKNNWTKSRQLLQNYDYQNTMDWITEVHYGDWRTKVHYGDVLVVCADPYDEETNSEGHVIKPAMDLVQGLRSSGVPVCVMSRKSAKPYNYYEDAVPNELIVASYNEKYHFRKSVICWVNDGNLNIQNLRTWFQHISQSMINHLILVNMPGQLEMCGKSASETEKLTSQVIESLMSAFEYKMFSSVKTENLIIENPSGNSSPSSDVSESDNELIDEEVSVPPSELTDVRSLTSGTPRKPMFLKDWQTKADFSNQSGHLQGEDSDVVLYVPENAVKGSNVVTVNCAVCTNLKEVHRNFMLDDSEIIVAPVAEYYAGEKFVFQKPVRVTLPHFLPPTYKADQVRVYRIHRDENGDIHKENLDLRSITGEESPHAEVTGNSEYFYFSRSQHIHVLTTHFSAIVCTYCQKEFEPFHLQLRLHVAHKQYVKRDVKVCLFVWDKRLEIKDFQKEVLTDQERDMTLIMTEQLKVAKQFDDLELGAHIMIHQDQEHLWMHCENRGKKCFPVEWRRDLEEIFCSCMQDSPVRVTWLLHNKDDTTPQWFSCFIEVGYITRSNPLPPFFEDHNMKLLFVHNLPVQIQDISTSPTDVSKHKDPTEEMQAKESSPTSRSPADTSPTTIYYFGNAEVVSVGCVKTITKELQEVKKPMQNLSPVDSSNVDIAGASPPINTNKGHNLPRIPLKSDIKENNPVQASTSVLRNDDINRTVQDISIVPEEFMKSSTPIQVITGELENTTVSQDSYVALENGTENNSAMQDSYVALENGTENNSAMQDSYVALENGTENNNAMQDSYVALENGTENNNAMQDSYVALANGPENNNAMQDSYATLENGTENNCTMQDSFAALENGNENNNANNNAMHDSYAALANGTGNNCAMQDSYAAMANGIENNCAMHDSYAALANGTENNCAMQDSYAAMANGTENNCAMQDSYAALANGNENNNVMIDGHGGFKNGLKQKKQFLQDDRISLKNVTDKNVEMKIMLQ